MGIDFLTTALADYSQPHVLNIYVHVGAGTLALFIGLAQITTRKGGRIHRFLGRLFLAVFTIVILTAATGIALFAFNAFLAVIALLSAYQAISGVRVFSVRDRGLKAFDFFFALGALGAVAGFIAAIRYIDFPWDETIIYSTLAYLALIAGYDLLRFALPRSALQRTWIYEHLAKMLGALSALASAFTGTVFPNYQPLSQLAPSVLGVALILFFAAPAAHLPSRK